MERSKVSKFPRAVREELEQSWRSGQFTIDQLLEWLHTEHPAAASTTSRAGLARYLRKYKETFDRIREAQEVAAHAIEQAGQNTRGNVGRLLTQLLSAHALSSLNQLDPDKPVDSEELFFLSTAIKNLAGAEKTTVELELRIRKEIAAELQKKVAPALKDIDEATRAGGLSADTAAAIRKAIAEVEV